MRSSVSSLAFPSCFCNCATKPDSKAMKREAPEEQQYEKSLSQQLYAETFNITFETQETFILTGQYPFNTRNQSIHTKLHTSAELNGRNWVSTLLLLLTHIALPTLTDKMKRISEQPQNEQCKLEKATSKANDNKLNNPQLSSKMSQHVSKLGPKSILRCLQTWSQFGLKSLSHATSNKTPPRSKS